MKSVYATVAYTDKHFTLHRVMTKIFMRKYRRPARYTHCVYFGGEKIASIIRAYADMYSIAWHVDFFNFPRYGAICRAILDAAQRVESHKNVLIYEQ